MQNCLTCKFWKKEAPDDYQASRRFDMGDIDYDDFGKGPYVDNPKFAVENDEPLHLPKDAVGDWGECTKAEGRNGQPLTETLVFAKDTSAYHATLSTRKDFGCVLHEEHK